jgi:colicin import membrane protein
MSIERKSDRWISITQSVVLHGLVVGALAYGFYAYKHKPTPPQPTLAVEASVVEQKSAAPPPKTPEPAPPTPPPEQTTPEPPPPPPEDVGPPAPTPEQIQQREQAQREEQQKKEDQKREEERVALEKKQAEEAAAKAAAEQKARDEEAERKRKAAEAKAAEEKRVAEAKRKAEELRKAELAREQAERDAELRKSLEAEERANQIRSSGVVNTWLAQIQAKVKRAWIRPQSARAGLDCEVRVTQTPGGEVTAVSVGECNGDAAVRASIEDAVYRASPLPPAPDPAVFDRNLVFHFRPTD